MGKRQSVPSRQITSGRLISRCTRRRTTLSVGREDLVFNRRELLQRFWDQIGRIRPETYLAEGDLLVLATENRGFFENVISTLR